MDNPGSRAAAGRGVGPSAFGQLTRDRSLRLAAGLAIAVAIPVAVLFYFQFRSLSNLGQSSTVVLRQLSQETSDGVAKSVKDALKAPQLNVLLRITQAQTEPLDLPFIEAAFQRSMEIDTFVSRYYVWSDETVSTPRTRCWRTTATATSSSPTRRKPRCSRGGFTSWRPRSAPSASSKRPWAAATSSFRGNSASRFRRAIG